MDRSIIPPIALWQQLLDGLIPGPRAMLSPIQMLSVSAERSHHMKSGCRQYGANVAFNFLRRFCAEIGQSF